METFLNAKIHRATCDCGLSPRVIIHSSKEVEKEWRETLTTAFLKLLVSLIKRYTKIIGEGKQTLDGILIDVPRKIEHTKKKKRKRY